MDFPVLVEELNDAIARGTAKRRSDILQRITDLFMIGSADYTDEQIDVFDDVFVRLVTTLELSTKSTLARRLVNEPRAPIAISRMLASDEEIDVAGPVLERSQRLDNATLLAAAKTKGQQHLLAISQRNSIDPVVTEVLVERGDDTVVLRTVANPGAQFSDKGYTALVKRSEESDEIATTFALRRDVPRQHLMRLLVRASDTVRRKLEAVDPQFSSMIQDAVAEGAIMIMEKVDIASQNLADIRKYMETLHTAGRLGEKEVLEFAATNRIEETIAALSVLCEIPVESVDHAMIRDRPDAVLVMARAAEMSLPTVTAILRMRAGVRGISPGELQHCLDTFLRLTPAVARQIIRFREQRAQRTRFTRPSAEMVLPQNLH